jgi:hypothetical protein
MDKLAEDRAQQRAPKPKYEPMIAGITGLMLTSVVCSTFMALAGLDTENFTQAVAITSTLGFATPFFYIRHGEKLYYRAYEQEMQYQA